MDERARRVAAWFEPPILVAALLVIPVIAIEQSSVGEPWRAIAGVVNWVIWFAFAIELAAMLLVVRTVGAGSASTRSRSWWSC